MRLTQKRLDAATRDAKRIADKYIARDGGPPHRAVEPRVEALALLEKLARAEAWELWPAPLINCRCAMPRTLEDITAILEQPL